jgi:hypothetical protein
MYLGVIFARPDREERDLRPMRFDEKCVWMRRDGPSDGETTKRTPCSGSSSSGE